MGIQREDWLGILKEENLYRNGGVKRHVGGMQIELYFNFLWFIIGLVIERLMDFEWDFIQFL